jgi:hypothetical protein
MNSSFAKLVGCVGSGLLVVVLAACQPIQPETASAAPIHADTVSPSDPVEVQIANAMSAAPMAIAQDATILGFPKEEGGDMVVLRKGSNNWVCYADWPASPGNDPQCNDPVWEIFAAAYAAGTEPEITGPGIGYMLAGGSDPSAHDPYLMQPAEGEEWVASPAHIMLLLPGGFDSAYYTTDHASGHPYIMWDGTPYEHLMVPVANPAE